MRKTFVLCVSVIFMGLGAGALISYASREYSDLVRKCKGVKLGDSEKHILKELGHPSQIYVVELNGQQLRVLTYPAPSIAATAPHIYIDQKSGVVTRVVCEDQYDLMEKGRSEHGNGMGRISMIAIAKINQ